jgi:L-seryl-tRNA(Ser) seleniumtransferase
VTRPGGLVLAALQEVALAYLDRRAGELPFWRLATTPEDVLRRRAEELAAGVGPSASVTVTACRSVAGGGALPGVEIPSWGLALDGDHRAALRTRGPRPVVARVRQGETVLDLRTVDPADDPVVADALAAVIDAAG